MGNCDTMGFVERMQLQEWKNNNVKVRFITINGFHIVGYVNNFDDRVIKITTGKGDKARTEMLYIHALSTMKPNSGSSDYDETQNWES